MDVTQKWILFFCLWFLSSCTVGPNYQRPHVPVKNKWATNKTEAKVAHKAPIDVSWWKTLHDPLLNRYIDEAVKNNLDIKMADARICQARAMKQVSLANFYPMINTSASANSLQISKNTLEGILANSPMVNFIDRSQWIYNLGFDAQWELDVFGKNRRLVEANQASLEEMVEKRRTILLSTVAEVARSYVELRGAQHLLSTARKNLARQKKTLQLVRQQYQAGSSNEVAVAMSEAQLKETESQLPSYIAQIQVNAHQVAILLGKGPQAILDEVATMKPLPKPIKKVPMGLRSDILRQRPDIRATERQLASSVAEIGAAVADFFPQFNLSVSSLAFQSTSLGNLLQSNSGFWFMGPLASMPIFRGGQIKANVANKKAIAQEVVSQYRKVILQALQETQSALARYSQSMQTNTSLHQSVAANQKATKLARKRYEYGEDDYLALLDSEGALLNAETQAISSQVSSLTNLISLYKALGGGWQGFEG